MGGCEMNGNKHMKPLSKLNQEAIAKAKSVDDQNRAAAMAMIEKPIEMIKAIMLKHELAVIEVMRELHESREAAVSAERKACAELAMQGTNEPVQTKTLEILRKERERIAEAIRARGDK
jgi:putative heme iron utilization protein